MDELDGLLTGARARGGVFNLTILDRPWGLEIVDGAPLALAMMVRGSGWVLREGAEAVRMAQGDVVVLSGGRPYVVVDSLDTAPTLRIHPGGVCEPLPGAPVDYSARLGVRTHGARPDGETILVSGTYQMDCDVGRRLLSALPATTVVPAVEVGEPVMRLVLDEIVRDRPAQQTVLDRWLDLALITTLRAWFDGRKAQAPGWYRGHSDPVVGAALRLIHDDPARGWRLSELAKAVGVSRASLTRRFTVLVGEPPMTYLTGWRLSLAADLLRDTDHTVGSIAEMVGYANAFALSAAFKRVRGISPTVHRRSAASPDEYLISSNER
ncbi:MAG TPA: AraC family transcriptional regulator [Nocardioidaceae bacterium]|nr:AraC family transcriptional regulator [Nocardioidaceae bacterium]